MSDQDNTPVPPVEVSFEALSAAFEDLVRVQSATMRELVIHKAVVADQQRHILSLKDDIARLQGDSTADHLPSVGV